MMMVLIVYFVIDRSPINRLPIQRVKRWDEIHKESCYQQR